ncbi:MAG: group II intron reverse transcriptase domain-containing protein, partial [Desulfovibrio sp.]|nr:group II intron reverse transcriptase domain-containing protein [Desulfovibrio sp.]
MPKTAKGLWEKFLAWDNFMLAVKMASKGKRYHWEVLRFIDNLEENLVTIRDQLANETWYPGTFRTFTIFEPKERIIHAPSFRDRVVHHALVQVIGDYFEKRFIAHSFACRKNKGTHAASSYLTHMLRSARNIWNGKVYVLKADISKYFPSIDHDILFSIISRTIGDKRILNVIKRLINNCSCITSRKGLPLGALTSQLFANTYLDVLDHFIKDDISIHYYVRYMDDFIVLHSDKDKLWKILDAIRDFLTIELQLTINPKTNIFPASHGVDFAGYRHWADHTLPRKRNLKRAAKRFTKLSQEFSLGVVDLETVRSSMASFVGYIQH